MRVVNRGAADTPLTEWLLASTAVRHEPASLEDLRFAPVEVPGTVASDLPDAEEHWFRCRFSCFQAEPGEELWLDFDGIATLAEVWLNGQSVLTSRSMFARHAVDITRIAAGENELLVVCRALIPALEERKGKAPRARWRTRVAEHQQLRWFRTTLLGRAHGAPAPQSPAGIWRPVTLRRLAGLALENWSRALRVEGSTGIAEFAIAMRLTGAKAMPRTGRMHVGTATADLQFTDKGQGRVRACATVRLPDVALWWPHTHAEPRLYPVWCEIDREDGTVLRFEGTAAGFAHFASADQEGLALVCNGRPIFCRGVVWTAVAPRSCQTPYDETRARLLLLREAGFNLIRLAGTGYYENAVFHSLCDELGFLVWQDLMFANFDYPFDDPAFHSAALAEVEAELARLQGHTSTAVVCGSSEVEQQAAMLGLDAGLRRSRFFTEEVPALVKDHLPQAHYVQSAPSGGDLPFYPRAGVANYFGVGAYLRPVDDARRAGVRFASECLAFSHLPEPERLRLAPEDQEWKSGVPRDAGADWDFADVRDHYLGQLFAIDPEELRRNDAERYAELSRLVPGELMAEVFGEWRRAASPCQGGILLWCADLMPGAGWGILDDSGQPKSAYWFLKRALAPTAIWMTDEGLNGVDIHLANDGPLPSELHLRVALYRANGVCVAQAEARVVLSPGETRALGVERLLGRFVDAGYAYRFGPPNHDLIAATLRVSPGEPLLAQAFHFPHRRPLERQTWTNLGVTAAIRIEDSTRIEVTVEARCFVWGVRVAAAGWRADDRYFGIEPGETRRVALTRMGECAATEVEISAVNAEGTLRLPVSERSR